MSGARTVPLPRGEQERREAARDDAKREAAQLFDKACRASGKSLQDTGDDILVSASRVAKLRSDDPAHLDVVPTIADLLLADHDIAERMLHEIIAARRRRHGARPAVTVEQQLAASMLDVLALANTGVVAMANGTVDPPEVPPIDEAAAKAEGSIHDLRARLREMRR